MTGISLHKHASIWAFLGGLSERVDYEHYQVIDNWDADLYAVGVAAVHDPAQLVYICTFAQPLGRYTYECEVAAQDGSYVTTERGSARNLEEMAAIVQRHLSVPAPQVGPERPSA